MSKSTPPPKYKKGTLVVPKKSSVFAVDFRDKCLKIIDYRPSDDCFILEPINTVVRYQQVATAEQLDWGATLITNKLSRIYYEV